MYINQHLILTADTVEPAGFQSWIHHQDSLTDQLERLTGDTQLTLLSQGWTHASWWDAMLFQLNQPLFQREILMSSHGTDYWYARSVIPEACYASNLVFFQRLQKESIRNLIFGNNDVKRLAMHVYPVNHSCLEFHWVKKYLPLHHETLWVRCAQYGLPDGTSFYLIEILLPSLEGVCSIE